MTLTERPALGRAAALAILAALGVLFCVGPLAAYGEWIAGNAEALAAKAAVLQRYRLLTVPQGGAPAPVGPALLYPDMPESQATAVLQETVKTEAAKAHVQVLGLQVLRGEAAAGATRIGVRVRASGDIAGLRNLLYAIESARPVLYPDNLAIQSHVAAPGTAPATLDFQFDIAAFKAERAS
ncbi:MAG TPA: type II secretion system protein GspM [Stellaceae bacterium]|nr:type II secretion system protein GspM [Stellaceae bacterium]